MRKLTYAYFENLRQEVSWPELLRIFRIRTVRKGQKQLVSKCVFHGNGYDQERTPSLYFNHRPGCYHCFGCGKGGDVFKFVQDYLGLNQTQTARFFRRNFDIAPR